MLKSSNSGRNNAVRHIARISPVRGRLEEYKFMSVTLNTVPLLRLHSSSPIAPSVLSLFLSISTFPMEAGSLSKKYA